MGFARIATLFNKKLQKDYSKIFGPLNDKEKLCIQIFQVKLKSLPALSYSDYTSRLMPMLAFYKLAVYCCKTGRIKQAASWILVSVINSNGKSLWYDAKKYVVIVWTELLLRTYLKTQRSTTYTNHNSLCWLLNITNPIRFLAQLQFQISKFEFAVIHHVNIEHQPADALPRFYTTIAFNS